ncbi:hypothetical protein [Opitutus terrae]|uniref:Uncharacterized protein n=1 Tax=Opitutus terrae (strain DSM 11246 / JCM 15787 / PB90-1) TaxID=452637 RepID=B1ZPG0_OPITP|nr:hypothetical protein [Opitutus terrae]ACB74479.1 hypothetical protein Oter_1193 [Opitutus terrae PB90-1]
MNTNETPDPSAANLLTLRNQPDPVKVITDRLRVREMGPADHIRTKHEVKAWVETAGDAKEAEAIITRARARRELQQTQSVTQKMTERQGQRMDP